MANHSAGTFSITAENIFELAKTKEEIEAGEKNYSVNSFSIDEMEVDKEDFTLKIEFTGRWSVAMTFFERVAEKCVNAGFYEAEQGNDFFRAFEYVNGEQTFWGEDRFMSKAHMENVQDDQFFFEELVNYADGYDSYEDFKHDYKHDLEDYFEVYETNEDDFKQELVSRVYRTIEEQKSMGL